MKKALITGIGGQDGSYLAEHLYRLGYEVHGTIRRSAGYHKNVTVFHLGNCTFHYADLRDETSLETIIRRVHPGEIYNLAGQTFVPPSWTHPAETFDVNVGGLARILKLVELVDKKIRVYQASSSEMYGNVISTAAGKLTGNLALNEHSAMNPVSPYGVSKLAAHKLVDAYRQKGLYVVSGILFNHESPRRGEEMVTRKITKHIAQWVTGNKIPLKLGNVYTQRDWGFAGDYVQAMQAMLWQEQADDYVVGTGEAHSVDEFLRLAVKSAGLIYDHVSDMIHTEAREFSRENELNCLVADSEKANDVLNWRPIVSFEELVTMMVESDVERAWHELDNRNSIVRKQHTVPAAKEQ